MTEIQQAFDYGSLAETERVYVQERASLIRDAAKRTAHTIVLIGQWLTEAQARLPHGKWLDWLAQEFGWTLQTALNFTRVYEHFGKSKTVLDLPIDVSSLYLIAAPKTPECVRQQIIERAESGEPITKTKTLEVLAEHRREMSHSWEPANSGYVFPDYPSAPIPQILKQPPSVHFSSETPEWYTPDEIIERTVALLGGIDLDPCSNQDRSVPAKTHYTQTDDGLSKQWTGTVYMNPPYGREISAWVEKLCAHYTSGEIHAAIALVPARVDTEWFSLFRDQAVCFVRGRLKFSGSENSAPFPSAVVYLGRNLRGFDEEFGDLGDVWVRWASEL